jgi:hypothetical protein
MQSRLFRECETQNEGRVSGCWAMAPVCRLLAYSGAVAGRSTWFPRVCHPRTPTDSSNSRTSLTHLILLSVGITGVIEPAELDGS